MNLFNLALPSLWVVKGKLPGKDGMYRCRLKQNGGIAISTVEFREGRFITDTEILAWEL